MRLDQITGELLNRAIAIYRERAFKDQVALSRAAPRFEPRATLPEILAGAHPFEDLSGEAPPVFPAPAAPASGGAPKYYALRLGNFAYPHMKLALVEAYAKGEFVFIVDRHDTFHFDPGLPGFDAWCELKEINRLLKDAIEEAWYEAGIPTRRRLYEKRFARAGAAGAAGAGSTGGTPILVLDDDAPRAEIVRGILEDGGYTVIVGPPGPKPHPGDTAVILARTKAKCDSQRLAAKTPREADNVDDLVDLIVRHGAALIVMDVSFRTGQGPCVAAALRGDPRVRDVPILSIYARRDFSPDPELFESSLRRPYHAEALLELVKETLARRAAP